MYRSLVTLSLVLTLLTIVLSAYIRLAEVGIGCEGWPDCYAQLDPQAEKRGVAVLTARGQDMQYRGARIAHRYIASALGLFVVAVFAMSLRRGRRRSTGLLVPSAILAVTVFLSLLGYYTPTRSNPLITMGNLLGGMLLLGLLWWQMQREVQPACGVLHGASLRPWALLALLLVVLQIVLGGWSSANYASANCPGLLQCRGEIAVVRQWGDVFNPFRIIELGDQGQVVRSDALSLLSLVHRFFALLTAAYLAWLVRRVKVQVALSVPVLMLSILSMGQLAIGASMIWLRLPLPMVTLHNAVAACLLLACINLLHHLTPVTGFPPPD